MGKCTNNFVGNRKAADDIFSSWISSTPIQKETHFLPGVKSPDFKSTTLARTRGAPTLRGNGSMLLTQQMGLLGIQNGVYYMQLVCTEKDE